MKSDLSEKDSLECHPWEDKNLDSGENENTNSDIEDAGQHISLNSDKTNLSSVTSASARPAITKFIIPRESEYNTLVLKMTRRTDSSEAEKREVLSVCRTAGLSPYILETEEDEQIYALALKESLDNIVALIGTGESECSFTLPDT